MSASDSISVSEYHLQPMVILNKLLLDHFRDHLKNYFPVPNAIACERLIDFHCSARFGVGQNGQIRLGARQGDGAGISAGPQYCVYVRIEDTGDVVVTDRCDGDMLHLNMSDPDMVPKIAQHMVEQELHAHFGEFLLSLSEASRYRPSLDAFIAHLNAHERIWSPRVSKEEIREFFRRFFVD